MVGHLQCHCLGVSLLVTRNIKSGRGFWKPFYWFQRVSTMEALYRVLGTLGWISASANFHLHAAFWTSFSIHQFLLNILLLLLMMM